MRCMHMLNSIRKTDVVLRIMSNRRYMLDNPNPSDYTPDHSHEWIKTYAQHDVFVYRELMLR
jgi:hypothetical protein